MSTVDAHTLTTAAGEPADSLLHSLSAGVRGPLLLHDHVLVDHLAHFDRERVSERVVHAKGSGFKGYFQTTHDQSKVCKAAFLKGVGTRTPVVVRFSLTGGERGASDVARDIRGFSIKHYTTEGNYDLVGNHTPVFFIRDPILFPSLMHVSKRDPQSNMKKSDAFWDFMSLVPESVHQVTMLMSDRGVPASYRYMDGFSVHTFRWVNAEGRSHWVKYHYKTDQGIKNLTSEEISGILKNDPENGPDYAQKDMFDLIAGGGKCSWTLSVQLIPVEDEPSYRFDLFDATKVVPFSDYPLHEVGKLVLDRNVDNYHAEVEQVAFSPSNLVPGIEPSPDKLLQGRIFSYPDTQRYRLGANWLQIPINCPFASKVQTYQRDGPMTVNSNGGSLPNYYPNSLGSNGSSLYEVNPHVAAFQPQPISGETGRYAYTHSNDDFEQPRKLWCKVFKEAERERTAANIAAAMMPARDIVKDRQLAIFDKVDKSYGDAVRKALKKMATSDMAPTKT